MTDEVIERTMGSQMSTDQKLAYARFLKRETEMRLERAKRYCDVWLMERKRQGIDTNGKQVTQSKWEGK